MPRRITEDSYWVNIAVFPDIGNGLARRLAEDNDMAIPLEYHQDWNESKEYVALVKIPEQRYPLRESLLVIVPLVRQRGCYKLDFENARDILTDKSFKQDYYLRNKRQEALIELDKVAIKKVSDAVRQISRNIREGKEPMCRRFTLSFELEDILERNNCRVGKRFEGGGAVRHKGKSPY